MIFFDYIYYRVYKFYEGFNESGPWAFGVPAMATSQYFFLVTLDRIIHALPSHSSFFLKGNLDYTVIFLTIIFNFVRYYWLVPYARLYNRWKGEDRKKHVLRGGLVIIYFFCALFCGLYFTGFFNRA
jgi:hypothetical protein